MTSRGLREADFEQIGEFLHEALLLCKEVQESHGRLLKDFVTGLMQNEKVRGK